MISGIILTFKTLGVILSYMVQAAIQFPYALIHRHTYRALLSPNEPPKNIVVIGASFAGFFAAKELLQTVPSGYRVVVVEKNSHFQFTWAFPRFCVLSGYEGRAFIPVRDGLKGYAPPHAFRWVTGCVERIIPDEKTNGGSGGEGKIVLTSGESIEYAYLIVATGATATLPSRVGKNDKAEGIAELQRVQERIGQAETIAVLGGGAAGVELAADIKSYRPEKEVTLIHSRGSLLNTYGEKLQQAAFDELTKLGVHICLGERVQLAEGQTEGEIQLKDEAVSFDYIVKCVGQSPNSQVISALSPSSVSPSGHIRTRPTLQIADMDFHNIFAAGDILDGIPLKNGRAACEQGQLVARNVVRDIQGRAMLQYHQRWWEGMTKMTLGLKKGVFTINDGVAEACIFFKGLPLDMGSHHIWSTLGVKPSEEFQ
ncbi:hypothetical protein ASPZODRAFT_133905 [Penicilliopsis zonata CBS 506.65]|uniref:FAD/NAD(P)-binding domain-containing protein n=1 Tax=Penicilliopsis zonata CBS 506.65 TaxID=1073090 RepID=A0A1L9SDU7_9EURO|nr:hypothetical protein ASPZODRAFT_133905 [Penicilliopsis zonata CBS 506.65]OJJ45264.1 hypothetical protein ASPZODRAFT_133905 [Penicilliopsis zonata CBS 506.65]